MSTTQISIDITMNAFLAEYGCRPSYIASAPGRIEVLGNHTDYNLGYVMSAAIDRYTLFAVSPSDRNTCRVVSATKPSAAEFNQKELEHDPSAPWADYIKGVVDQLQKAGVDVPVFDAYLTSDVPLGAGLSSSAALEVSCCLALLALAEVEWPAWKVAELGRAAENQFVGMPCGILDQFSSTFGVQDAMLWLDTRTKEHCACYLPQQPKLTMCLMNSMGVHALVTGDYANRFKECKMARDWFARLIGPQIEELRDVSLSDFLALKDGMDDVPMRRAKHIITENQRVQDAKAALESGDVITLGRLMYESHLSSSTDFENSTPGLDTLVGIANRRGALGARLMGGGWGGAVICLVYSEQLDFFISDVSNDYYVATGIRPDTFCTVPAEGAHIFRL
ncbi:MAG: galactokinase [Armatimonadota bacterium]